VIAVGPPFTIILLSTTGTRRGQGSIELEKATPMNRVIQIFDKNRLEIYFKNDPFLNIYQLGDLDDLFWQYSQWYGSEENEKLKAVILLYKKPKFPVLIALGSSNKLELQELLKAVMPELPGSVYCHLSDGLKEIVIQDYDFQSKGKFLKMKLAGETLIASFRGEYGLVRVLTEGDLHAIEELVIKNSPSAWLDKELVQSGFYHGIYKGEKLVSMAGVHVFSKRYNVAALGNVMTSQEERNKGNAAIVTASLCDQLLNSVKYIGLNVQADNHYAIRCYGRVGFEEHTYYEEGLAVRR
jgi:predicted GNAT family N-acyltransferase